MSCHLIPASYQLHPAMSHCLLLQKTSVLGLNTCIFPAASTDIALPPLLQKELQLGPEAKQDLKLARRAYLTALSFIIKDRQALVSSLEASAPNGGNYCSTSNRLASALSLVRMVRKGWGTGAFSGLRGWFEAGFWGFEGVFSVGVRGGRVRVVSGG